MQLTRVGIPEQDFLNIVIIQVNSIFEKGFA